MTIDEARSKLNLSDKLSEEDMFLLFFVMGEAMRLNGMSPEFSMTIVDKMGFFSCEKQIEYIEKWILEEEL